MKKANRTLQRFLADLDPDAKRKFARAARTTVESLYVYAGGHRTIGIDLAVRLEQAASKLYPDAHLSRWQLTKICGACPHRK